MAPISGGLPDPAVATAKATAALAELDLKWAIWRFDICYAKKVDFIKKFS